MKQLLALTISILTFSSVFGQTVINNALTAEHKSISGTKISIIPPKGFITAQNFLGLQQTQSGASIMIVDLPAAFSESAKGLTKEGFLSQGVEVKEIENLTLNNLPAIFVTGEQNARGSVYTRFVLCFGTDKQTIIINGASPNNLKEIAKEVKTSILTSFYDAGKTINPFDVVDYEVDFSKSKLRFANSMATALIFTTDGFMPTKSLDKTSLTIAKSFSNVAATDRKLFALNRLKQLPIEITKIESTEEITIDGISGYEIILASKDKKTSEPEKVYFAMLYSDSLYYIFYGSTNQDFNDNIDEIRKFVKTFKRK